MDTRTGEWIILEAMRVVTTRSRMEETNWEYKSGAMGVKDGRDELGG